MNYTKYLLIALAAASCCQVNGMIKYVPMANYAPEDWKSAKEWEASMCSAIQNCDKIKIKNLSLKWFTEYFNSDFNGYPFWNNKGCNHGLIWDHVLFHAVCCALTQNNFSAAKELLCTSHDVRCSEHTLFCLLFHLDIELSQENPQLTLSAIKAIFENLFEDIDAKKVASNKDENECPAKHIIQGAINCYGADHEITKYLKSVFNWKGTTLKS